MLYHRKVFWEEEFNEQINQLLTKPYILSSHVLERLDKHNYKHYITIEELETAINIIKTKRVRAFECEVKNNRVVKFATRVKLHNKDVSVVFLDKGNELIIKTSWRNSEEDIHKTLDTNKYYKVG